MKRKRPITLIEVMIVIVLIGIIASVVGYNMRGGLDKGREFQTERGREKLENVLNLVLMDGKKTAREIVADHNAVKASLAGSGYIQPSELDKLMAGGNGRGYRYTVDKGYIRVTPN